MCDNSKKKSRERKRWWQITGYYFRETDRDRDGGK